MNSGEPIDTSRQPGPERGRIPGWLRSYWSLVAVAAALAIWVVLSLLSEPILPEPIVCPDCKDPTRPLSYTCGEDHNPGPFFLDGSVNHYGAAYIGCSL